MSTAHNNNTMSTSDKVPDLTGAIGYLQQLNIKDNKDIVSICANCGKEGEQHMQQM